MFLSRLGTGRGRAVPKLGGPETSQQGSPWQPSTQPEPEASADQDHLAKLRVSVPRLLDEAVCAQQTCVPTIPPHLSCAPRDQPMARSSGQKALPISLEVLSSWWGGVCRLPTMHTTPGPPQSWVQSQGRCGLSVAVTHVSSHHTPEARGKYPILAGSQTRKLAQKI